MPTFEEINAQAAERFDDEPVNPEQAAEQATEQAIEQAEQANEAAVQSEQIAAQATEQNAAANAQMQQLQQQIMQMQEQNRVLQQTIQQMGEQQKESVVEEMTAPPILDFNSMAFDDEETVKAKLIEYSNQMRDYAKKDVLNELEPLISEAKRGREERNRRQLFEEMKSVEQLKGIEEHLPELEAIIQNNPIFAQDMPLDQKYITAYVMLNGINSIQNPQSEPNVDELMNIYDNNPEFREALEQRKIQNIKSNQQVPNLSASAGVANAAPIINNKPKSWDDVNSIASKYFK